MGRVAHFTRSRNQDVRNKHAQRAKRSQSERNKRRGEDQASRKLQRVVAQRQLPSEADRQLLLDQFIQACRLPAPSSDLCLLMRHYAGTLDKAKDDVKDGAEPQPVRGAKRARETTEANPAALKALADVFLSTASTPVVAEDDDEADAEEDEDPMTVLLAILQNNYGRRVVSGLLDALHDTQGCEAKCREVAKVVLGQFEENEHLAEHHVACRVMSALVQCGYKEVSTGVLNLLRQRCMDLDSVTALLRDRHTAVTVANLLKADSAETSKWLCDVLGLVAAPVPKGKSKKATKAGATESSSSSLSEEGLMKLIEDPVSGQVVRELINPTTRPLLQARLNVSTLLASKRGTSFLSALLTVPPPSPSSSSPSSGSSSSSDNTDAAAAFAATLDNLLEQTGANLCDMALDRQANFVVQKVLLLIPHTAAKRQGEYFMRVCELLGGSGGLQALANQSIGVHVLCTLIDAAFQSESAATNVEKVGSLAATQKNVAELLGSQHGSLVARRLMPLVKKSGASKVGHLLMSAVEQNLSSLMYDSIGNLVVQEYIKAIGRSEASTFAGKLKKDELLAMSRNQFAAHVVLTLLDAVDPTTHLTLCNLLKPYVATLAMHLNGRFIVEKLIPASRDVRDGLVRQFTELAKEKGTQHVLCKLVASLDPRGKQNLIDNVIAPSIRDLATHACGSIALQKLMQNDAAVLAAVQKRLKGDSLLTNELVQTFYGKFVVQIATHVSA